MRKLAERHPDAVVAAGLVVVWVMVTLGATTPAELEHGRWLGALVNLALLAPLAAVRRGTPAGVLLLVGTTALVTTVTLGTFGGEIAVAGALAAVTSRVGDLWRRGAAVVLTLVAALAAVPFVDSESTAQTVLLVVACVVAATAVGTALRYGRALVRAREERAAQLVAERRQEAALAVAAERTRIARELHDVVAHSVSVMVRLADGAARSVEGSPERAKEAMGSVGDVGREALAELRGLVGVLRDTDDADLAPVPGLAELPALVERVRTAGLPVRFRVEGEPVGVRPGVQLTVHRVVQESLTNCLRHAPSARSVTVLLRHLPDALELEILDDDATPPPPPHPNGTVGHRARENGTVAHRAIPGKGLAGMRERVAVHGGRFEAGPRPGGGWSVHAWLPADGRMEP